MFICYLPTTVRKSECLQKYKSRKERIRKTILKQTQLLEKSILNMNERRDVPIGIVKEP